MCISLRLKTKLVFIYFFLHFSANENNMAKNQYKIAKNEEFISVWQQETCLWDVGAKVCKDMNEKNVSGLIRKYFLYSISSSKRSSCSRVSYTPKYFPTFKPWVHPNTPLLSFSIFLSFNNNRENHRGCSTSFQFAFHI